LWAYSARLKHIVIVDVLTIAAGFTLRAAAGGAAIAVPISHWLLVCTTLLALFLALSKRRHELALTDQRRDHRPILGDYTPYLLDQMISVVTASTLIAYAFYTMSPETTEKFGDDLLSSRFPFRCTASSAISTSCIGASSAAARPRSGQRSSVARLRGTLGLIGDSHRLPVKSWECPKRVSPSCGRSPKRSCGTTTSS
jgi:hypothetical protein